MRLTQYMKRELQAFAWIMLPYIMVLNALMFGPCIFNSVRQFQRVFVQWHLVLAYFVLRGSYVLRMRFLPLICLSDCCYAPVFYL